MAIVINGSTGISATESSTVLGDNAVETADIAANAVTAAKLASTLDLTGKTVTLPAGVGGKVLQAVTATYATEVSVATTTYTDTGLSASITPSSESSKIMILLNQPITTYIASGGVYNYTKYKLVKNSTDLFANEYGISIEAGGSSNSNISTSSTLAISYLDSPATTSSVTYKTQIAPLRTVNSGVSKAQNGNSTASIVLLEIAA